MAKAKDEPPRRRRVPRFCVRSLKSWRSADNPDLLRLRAFLALCDIELDALSVLKRLVAVGHDRREVDENVLAPVDRDKAVALLAVEPLDAALCHCALPHFIRAERGLTVPPSAGLQPSSHATRRDAP